MVDHRGDLNRNVRRQVSEFFKCSDRTFIPPGIGGFTHRRSAIMAIRPFGFAAAEGVLSPKHTRSTKEAPHRLTRVLIRK